LQWRKQGTYSKQQQQQLPVRSRFRGVWGDPKVGSLTLVSITTHKEADSKDPKKNFEKTILYLEKKNKNKKLKTLNWQNTKPKSQDIGEYVTSDPIQASSTPVPAWQVRIPASPYNANYPVTLI